MKNKRQTILFLDLDSTIMTNPFWTVIFPTISQLLSKKTGIPAESFIELMLNEKEKRLKNPPAVRMQAMNWDDIIPMIANQYGIQNIGSIEELVRLHSNPPYTALLDNALQVLHALSMNGRRKLVASSMGLSKYQFPVLRSLGLFKIFDDFLMPDLTGFLKTEPQFFNKYSKESSNSIFISVGDHFGDDIIFPKTIGFLAILKAPFPALRNLSPFERPYHLEQFVGQIRGLCNAPPFLPDAVIVDLEELLDVVSAIESRFQ